MQTKLESVLCKQRVCKGKDAQRKHRETAALQRELCICFVLAIYWL